MTGFEAAETETLTAIRANLLVGLSAVAASLTNGSFLMAGEKGAAPPSQSGQTTLALLRGVETELARRGDSGATSSALP